ncbi:ATP-binding protein [Desulfobacula sp.]
MNYRINSWWLFVLLLLYCIAPFSGQAENTPKKGETIRVVLDDNYPPYIFRDFNGDIQGILVDEWQLWEEKTGIKVNLIAMDWNKAQAFLLKGKADVIDTFFFTEKRAKLYEYTKPYATIDVPVFFHKNLGGIIDIASLQGFTIGVKAGDACIDVLKKQGITSLKEYNSYEAIVKAAVDHQIKVFSIDKPPAFYYLYKMNCEDEFRYSFKLYTGKFHRAVKKGRTDILKTVEDGFALINKKEQNVIEKKWMGEPLTRPPSFRYVLFFFLFAGLIFLVLIFFNITLRRKVRLKTSEFQDLFNSIADLIYTQDMEGYFISANPAMQRLFGYTMDEFIGHKASDFMKPEFQSGFNSRYLEVIKKQGIHEGISCYFKKNNEKLYLEYKSSLVKPDKGKPYISGIARDVTEKFLSEKKLEKLQAQIAQSQKMETIGTLAGGIAHDFNNILSPILGYAEMLLEDIAEDSPSRDNLNEIYTSALRAKNLVKQILAFSRQEITELQLVKIQPIVKETLKLLRSTIPTTIDIEQDINNDCGAIKADPTQIHQIIMNLSTNAYHAMAETGGELKISLKEVELGELDLISPDMTPGAYACLSVSDKGTGMDKNLIEKIFDPFFTTKEKGKGTGMGLSVVHGIVKKMNGVIQVYSEPNKGTQFYVYFPVEKGSFEEQNIQMQGPIQKGMEHILLVDDEEAIITMEKKMLDRLGYQVTSRTSSLEALESFRATPDKFDIVITDMAMPNMPGDKFSTELVKIRPDIPILLCTGFSESISEEKAAALGIKAFLLKPVVMKDLARKIRDVLDKTNIKTLE